MKVTRRNSKFQVKKSRPGLGRGLFATHDIQKGEFIIEYIGRRISTAYADTLKTKYLFEIDQTWTIDGSETSNVARYINHACEPNSECEIDDGRIYVYATRTIKEGEEITIDYGDEYFDEFIRPQGCRCKKCSAQKLELSLKS